MIPHLKRLLAKGSGRKWLFIILFFWGGMLPAQGYLLNKANAYYNAMAYNECIPYYEKYLKKKFDFPNAGRLAEAHRILRNFKSAELWFKKIAEDPQAEPIHLLRYAQMLTMNGKYSEAKSWFEKYGEQVPSDRRVIRNIEICDSIEIMKKLPASWELKLSPFNSLEDDFAPMFYREGIAFSSNRNEVSLVNHRYDFDGKAFLDLYYVPVSDSGRKTGTVRPLRGSFRSPFHEGATCYDRVNGLIYFTRNSFDHPKGKGGPEILHLKIYSMPEKSQNLKEVKSLPFNSNEYSVGHPCLSADGKSLFFVSDMPGGYGGTDVYISEMQDSIWGAPINLGPDVNSPGNEMFPFQHRDGTLYFASDGQAGFGGLDLFSSNFIAGVWGNIKNMGFPINSSADDFSFIISPDRENAYLASNRAGGKGGDDIYRVKAITPDVNCPFQTENGFCVTLFEKRGEEDGMDSLGLVYEWDFGDGEKARGTEVSHCFPGPGKYLVKLNLVESISGFIFGTDTERELTFDKINQLYIQCPDTIAPGKEVIYDAGHSVVDHCTVREYVWDFGQGFNKKGTRVSHRFNTEGEYVIRLRANGIVPNEAEPCVTCISKRIVVSKQARKQEMPIPAKQVEPSPVVQSPVIDSALTEIPCADQRDQFCFLFFEKSVDSVQDPNISYEWDFGDGTKTRGLQVEHCFPGPGAFQVKLNMIDRVSGFVFSTETEYELNTTTLPIVRIDCADSVHTDEDFALSGKGSVIEGCNDFVYRWDKGEGFSTKGESTSLRFKSPGLYTIKMRVDGKNRAGEEIADCKRCVSRQVTVVWPDVPISKREVAPIAGAFQKPDFPGYECQSQKEFHCFTFDGRKPEPSNPDHGYRWTFNNAQQVWNSKVDFCFEQAGNYPVKLELVEKSTGKILSLESESMHEVLPQSPVHVKSKPTLVPGESFVLEAQYPRGELEPVRYDWRLTGGIEGSGEVFAHTWDQAGKYRAVLRVKAVSLSGDTISSCIYRDFQLGTESLQTPEKEIPTISNQPVLEKDWNQIHEPEKLSPDSVLNPLLTHQPDKLEIEPIANKSETHTKENQEIAKAPVDLIKPIVKEKNIPLIEKVTPAQAGITSPEIEKSWPDRLPVIKQKGVLPEAPALLDEDMRFSLPQENLLNKSAVGLNEYFKENPNHSSPALLAAAKPPHYFHCKLPAQDIH